MVNTLQPTGVYALVNAAAKALQPSLGDIEPVGIDDAVKKFFDVK